MPPQNAFDAFLSYNDTDKPVVRQIGEELRSRGVQVWFDEWELRPGGVIQDAKAEIIEAVPSAVIFVSNEGFTPWQSTELRAAIDQFIRRQIPVIPVLLPGAAPDVKLPLFLSQFLWVDMRAGLSDEALDKLQWGITGVKPTPRATATLQTRRMTVVELDLARYSDILRSLEENSTVESATAALSKQIDDFLNAGIAAAQVPREETLMSVAGDGAILIFENAAQAHHFARGVHDATEKYNANKTVPLAKRWFRIGAATGEIVVNVAQKQIGGITIANAVRLEAAADLGGMLIDKATHAALPADLQPLYGAEETVRGKRDEKFVARRCVMAQSAPEPAKENTKLEGQKPEFTTREFTGNGIQRMPVPRLIELVAARIGDWQVPLRENGEQTILLETEHSLTYLVWAKFKRGRWKKGAPIWVSGIWEDENMASGINITGDGNVVGNGNTVNIHSTPERQRTQGTESPALKVWREKLEFLQEEEATAQGSAKFTLRKEIEEAKAKIHELGG